MTNHELARLIDHTILKPEATGNQIDRLCGEAIQHGFFAVCVNPVHVARAAAALAGTSTAVASVAGFPLGANLTTTKVEESRRAIGQGAVEVDMVIDVAALTAGDLARVTDDVAAVAQAVHDGGAEHVLKVILETAALSADQIAAGCRCCVAAGADFVKTSTGFHPGGGATIESVRLLRQHAPGLGVKASGGIRDRATALAMVEAGATRLGTSSGVTIVAGD